MDIVDLRSDTVTRPSVGMRRAMADAEVGDDVFGEDPTVNRLQTVAAEMLGKEAALFVPTGTMANLLGFLSQTRPGDAVLLSEDAHPFRYERANLAMVGGLLPVTIPGQWGKITSEALRARIVVSDDPHLANTTLASLENTVNRGGGACYTVAETEALCAAAHERGLRVHCDGARIFNAAVALGVDASELARPCDSVSFCLSKGLGAPAGSLLTGPRETIARALAFRKMLGGGMRQAGVLAAAGLYALAHHIDDLREDHRRAREFREALERAGARFPMPSPTNMVYLETPDAPGIVDRLRARGVLTLATAPDRIRVVFHRDITDDGLRRAIEAFRAVLAP
ncbi:MAG: aminotransferase class I/II-fold pyridoxal phosphate-dependent enzyme [Candidatus Hydrogenedentes bacterium]|nr:aminotransferase class I/II-fold pyridoxal phosphate-dependent enzyme [Candidatus Hydrogenedentota bacterium]